MISSIALPNGYYLHEVICQKKAELFPGNKINTNYIYDVDNTSIFYINQQKESLEPEKVALDTEQNILQSIQKEPDIIICCEKSLSALFYYYKRFHKRSRYKPIIIIQTNERLPFMPVPSKILLPQFPNHMIAAVPYFEDLGIPSRIASPHLDLPGWYHGQVTDILPSAYQHILII